MKGCTDEKVILMKVIFSANCCKISVVPFFVCFFSRNSRDGETQRKVELILIFKENLPQLSLPLVLLLHINYLNIYDLVVVIFDKWSGFKKKKIHVFQLLQRTSASELIIIYHHVHP